LELVSFLLEVYHELDQMLLVVELVLILLFELAVVQMFVLVL
jgi:hypothetical protein